MYIGIAKKIIEKSGETDMKIIFSNRILLLLVLVLR